MPGIDVSQCGAQLVTVSKIYGTMEESEHSQGWGTMFVNVALSVSHGVLWLSNVGFALDQMLEGLFCQGLAPTW